MRISSSAPSSGRRREMRLQHVFQFLDRFLMRKRQTLVERLHFNRCELIFNSRTANRGVVCDSGIFSGVASKLHHLRFNALNLTLRSCLFALRSFLLKELLQLTHAFLIPALELAQLVRLLGTLAVCCDRKRDFLGELLPGAPCEPSQRLDDPARIAILQRRHVSREPLIERRDGFALALQFRVFPLRAELALFQARMDLTELALLLLQRRALLRDYLASSSDALGSRERSIGERIFIRLRGGRRFLLRLFLLRLRRRLFRGFCRLFRRNGVL